MSSPTEAKLPEESARAEAEVRRVEAETQKLTAEARRVEVDAYPLPTWPKLGTSIAILLFGGGSGSLGISEARALTTGWSNSLIPLISPGVSFDVLAVILLVFSLRGLQVDEGRKLVRYESLFFNQRAPSSRILDELLHGVGAAGFRTSARRAAKRPSTESAKARRRWQNNWVASLGIVIGGAALAVYFYAHDLTQVATIGLAVASGVTALYFVIEALGEQAAQVQQIRNSAEAADLRLELEQLRALMSEQQAQLQAQADLIAANQVRLSSASGPGPDGPR